MRRGVRERLRALTRSLAYGILVFPIVGTAAALLHGLAEQLTGARMATDPEMLALAVTLLLAALGVSLALGHRWARGRPPWEWR